MKLKTNLSFRKINVLEGRIIKITYCSPSFIGKILHMVAQIRCFFFGKGNLLTFSSGNASGWTTINFVELQSEKSTFPAGPLKLKEASLVISTVSLGACAGNFVALPIVHRFGIKRTIHICGMPIILSTLLIILAKNVYYLYVSRLLCGLSIGILVVALPSMVMAVSDDKVRGSLNALFDLFSNTGVILSFSLGNYLNWMDQAKVQLIPPTIAIIILFFLPESPEYWIKRNKEKRAIKAHKFYKGSILALEQAEYLQKLNEENVERENDNEIKSDPKLCLRDFLTPQAKRAYFIAFTGFVLNYCSGTILILSYVTDIFTKTGSSLSPKQSSILISVTQITTNIIFVNLVDRFNRRTLLICSSILATITYFVYAAYCLLWMNQSEYQWISSIPTVCFVLIIFFSLMGQFPIPFIVMTEIFPKKIRQSSLALANSFFSIISFALGSIFPIFLAKFGPFICMTSFGVMCVIHLVFNIVFLPETRGKSHHEIMKLMSR